MAEIEEVSHYASQLKWVDGVPMVIGVPLSTTPTASRMKELLTEAMNLPYDGHDPRYVGLTKGEAMIIDLVDQASLGDQYARKEVLDRALGKPVQNVNSVSVRGTIEEFLDSLPPKEPTEELAKVETIEIDSNLSHEADEL